MALNDKEADPLTATTTLYPADVLREVYRFAEYHEIDRHMMTVDGIYWGTAAIVLLAYPHESAITMLLSWARLLRAKDVGISRSPVGYHLRAAGRLPCGIPVDVRVVTGKHETEPLDDAKVGSRLTLRQLTRFAYVRPEKIRIDAAKALRALREVVTEYGAETRYQPPTEGGTYLYVWDGRPVSLDGHALHRAGLTIEQLAELDAGENGYLETADLSAWCELTDEARWILVAAQEEHDKGRTWGEALAAAECTAEQLGVERESLNPRPLPTPARSGDAC